MECHFYRWFLICFWCFSFSIPSSEIWRGRLVWVFGRWSIHGTWQWWLSFSKCACDEVVLMMSDQFASYCSGRNTFGTTSPSIVQSYGAGMTLGCNPSTCGRIQPLTSSISMDWWSLWCPGEYFSSAERKQVSTCKDRPFVTPICTRLWILCTLDRTLLVKTDQLCVFLATKYFPGGGSVSVRRECWSDFRSGIWHSWLSWLSRVYLFIGTMRDDPIKCTVLDPLHALWYRDALCHWKTRSSVVAWFLKHLLFIACRYYLLWVSACLCSRWEVYRHWELRARLSRSLDIIPTQDKEYYWNTTSTICLRQMHKSILFELPTLNETFFCFIHHFPLFTIVRF